MRKNKKSISIFVVVAFILFLGMPAIGEAAVSRTGFRDYKPVYQLTGDTNTASPDENDNPQQEVDESTVSPVYGSRLGRDYYSVGGESPSIPDSGTDQPSVPQNSDDSQTDDGVAQPVTDYTGGYDRYGRRGVYVPTSSPGEEPTVSDDNQTQTPEAPQEPVEYEMPPIPEGLTSQEAKAFELLNKFRIENGVPPVEIDMELVKLARMKAQDKAENDYSGHISPTYGSPGRMVSDAGISYRKVGENYAKAGTVTQCHYLLAYSTKGHREIMLNPDYTKVGIGIVGLKDVPGIIEIQLFIQPR